MKIEPGRTVRYYYLRFLRLKGDPDSIARGVALGVFIGLTPTLPLHTILILIGSPLVRGNLIAALLAATAVSNPLTFFFQYYAAWKLGNLLLPCDISWQTIGDVLTLITSGDASFRASLNAVTHLGGKTLVTLLAGGLLLALPAAIAGYYLSFRLVIKVRKKRSQKHILS